MKNRYTGLALLSAFTLFTAYSSPAAEDRRARVLNDRATVQAEGYWIYNDLPKGFAEASKTGKPMLVVLRCLP